VSFINPWCPITLTNQAAPEDSVEEEEAEDDVPDANAKKAEKKKTAKDFQYKDSFTYKIGVDEALKPICDIKDIFGDITDKACKLGLEKVITHLKGRRLKIATMCSGTESPLLAIQLVSDGKLGTLK
jgi:hypothetical protein